MKNLKWYQHVLLWIGIVGVFIGPWLFTRSYIGNWDFFDFSQSGSIGDTIGGITAPIVGLVSILLLWWTLRAQMDFNAKQDTINKEQKKFNDASRVLAMQAQIMQMDENIWFGYSTIDRTHEGKGCSSLRILQKGTPAKVRIPYEALTSLIEKVHMMDVSVCSLVNVAKNSDLTNEEKKSTLSIALIYLDSIIQFYEMAGGKQIDYLLPINDLGNGLIGLPSAQAKLETTTKRYSEKVKAVKEECEKIINA